MKKRCLLLLLLMPEMAGAQAGNCDTTTDLQARYMCLKEQVVQMDSILDSTFLALNEKLEVLIKGHADDPVVQDMYISAKLRFEELRKSWEKYLRTECDLCYGVVTEDIDARICAIRCQMTLTGQKIESIKKWLQWVPQ